MRNDKDMKASSLLISIFNKHIALIKILTLRSTSFLKFNYKSKVNIALEVVRYGLVSKLYPVFVTSCTVAPPGSSVHDIYQARILEWVAISLGDISDPGLNLSLLHCRWILNLI